jgi:hypothetical protein
VTETIQFSPRTFWVALAGVIIVFVAHGVSLAQLLVPSHDESNFLFVAYLATTGQLSLYGDGVAGHRAPVPYYVFGATQVLWGRDLLPARLLGVSFGAFLILFTGVLGRRVGGDLSGVLAAALLTAQGAVVGYYAMGDYHALVPMLIVVGLLVFLPARGAAGNVLGAAIMGSLFFMRTHVWSLIPAAFLYGLWQARTLVERVLVTVVVMGPPAVFLLWDQNHLKILLPLPLIGDLLRPLGFIPFFELDARPFHGVDYQVRMLLRLARRYEFFLLATAVAVSLVAWRVVRSGRRDPYLTGRNVNLVAGLFLYMLVALFVGFRINFKWIGMYFASLAPLLAIVLGHAYSCLLSDRGMSARGRMVLGVFLACMLVLPVYFNRNPLVPIGEVRAADPFRAVRAAGAHLARLVPPDAKVFFFGAVDVYYISGLPPTWIPQIMNYDTLAVRDDDNRATLRSGYYGMPQVEQWLGTEADHAVISPQALDVFAEGFHGHPSVNRPKVARIRALLAERFEVIGRVDEYPYYSYDVYRRRLAARP